MKQEAQNIYYRKITESLPQPLFNGKVIKENLKFFSIHYVLLFLAVCFILSLFLAIISYTALVEARELRTETQDNFSYWEEVAKKNPNSPDAFFEAGSFALKLGDKKTAIKYLDKALELDPGFEKAKELSQRIGE